MKKKISRCHVFFLFNVGTQNLWTRCLCWILGACGRFGLRAKIKINHSTLKLEERTSESLTKARLGFLWVSTTFVAQRGEITCPRHRLLDGGLGPAPEDPCQVPVLALRFTIREHVHTSQFWTEVKRDRTEMTLVSIGSPSYMSGFELWEWDFSEVLPPLSQVGEALHMSIASLLHWKGLKGRASAKGSVLLGFACKETVCK